MSQAIRAGDKCVVVLTDSEIRNCPAIRLGNDSILVSVPDGSTIMERRNIIHDLQGGNEEEARPNTLG